MFMSDITAIAALAKKTFTELYKQVLTLGQGLQNAAPGDKMNLPNNSVQYLLSDADAFQKKAEECTVFTNPSPSVGRNKPVSG